MKFLQGDISAQSVAGHSGCIQKAAKTNKGMAVMLYILGLSYGAVEIILGSLGIGIGKTSVYRVVQYAAQKVPGMKQKSLLAGYQTKAV